MSDKRKDDDGGIGGNHVLTALFVFSPVIAIILVFLLVAWLCGRLGKSYENVKLFCIPVGWFVSTLVWFPVLFAVTAAISIITRGDVNCVRLMADLNLMVMWGPLLANTTLGVTEEAFGTYKPTEASHLTIILYQALLWFTVGKRVTRQLAIGIYDSTMVRHARNLGVYHWALHNVKVASSKAYAKDISTYREKGLGGPFFGIMLINLAGGDADEFYTSIK